MLGKTFKGLTDEILAWQTERLLAREESRSEHVVHVRPELVVEIAFDGVQASSGIRAASPCALPGSSATATTRPPPTPTRCRPCSAIHRGEITAQV